MNNWKIDVWKAWPSPERVFSIWPGSKWLSTINITAESVRLSWK